MRTNPRSIGRRNTHPSTPSPSTASTLASPGRQAGVGSGRTGSPRAGSSQRPTITHAIGTASTTKGTPTNIQLAKETSRPTCSEAIFTSTAFGKVPMGVATPPIEAAKDSPSPKALRERAVPTRSASRVVSGSSITTVAVLDTNVDIVAAAIIVARSTRRGEVRVHVGRSSSDTSRSCRPTRCIACPRKKPPTSRNSSGSA